MIAIAALQAVDLQTIYFVATTIGVGIAGIALIVTAYTNRKQQKLTETIHKEQMLLSQRQVLLPLWNHLNDLADINPTKPVWEDVRKAANVLELVAVSWEGQLIDENIIRRIFGDRYIEFYEKIQQCTAPPANVVGDGPAMLRENRAATSLYTILKKENIDRDRLAPIGGNKATNV